MADNTTLNAGTGGDVIATDDITGVKHQQVKVEWGVDGTATPVSAANPMPVVQTGTHAVNATLGAETTKVIGTVNLSADQTLATVTAVTAITNALPAGTNAIGKLSANSGVDIGDTDVTSIIPGTGATNLGKAEDAAHTSGDVGILALGIRRDADTTPVSADGDYHAPIFDANGYLKVNIKAGAGSGGTAMTDAAAFTRATTSVTPIAAVVETSAPTLTNGNAGALSLTTGGAVRVSVASGGVAGVSEDAASAGGEEGLLMMGIRQDTISSSTSADGDFAYPKFNSVGALYTAVYSVPADPFGVNADAASATGSISAKLRFIGATGIPITALPASTNTLEVVGDAAHDAAISGNPVRLSGRALTADYTAVAAGDTADLITTLLGKLVTIPYANPNQTWSYAAASGGIVNTTGVTAKAAAGSGIRNYITHVSVINGHATVDTDVQIRDGAAGTVLWRGFAKAAGGGVSESFDPPLRGTENTLVEVANATTGSATYFNMQGFTAAE